MRIRALPFYGFLAVSISAQTMPPPTIGATGYTASSQLTIAPGQLLTLFVPGLGNTLTGPMKAPPGPLPTSLGGIAAVLKQGTNQPLPIFQVQSISTCTAALPPPMNSCSSTLAVTVQIPFNIEVVCPLCLRPIALIPIQIAVSVNGAMGPFADATAVADQIHFITACDVIMPGSSLLRTPSALPCAPMVTHADGTLVSARSPANSGEELVAYATGLGQTDPPLTTGQASTAPAPTLTVFAMDFNYRSNALATKPLGPNIIGVPPPYQSPIFSGATAGFVGLYQINFIVPPVPAGLPPCADANTVQPYANVVQSNLTVSAGSVYSFDGAGICVLPPGVSLK